MRFNFDNIELLVLIISVSVILAAVINFSFDVFELAMSRKRQRLSRRAKTPFSTAIFDFDARGFLVTKCTPCWCHVHVPKHKATPTFSCNL